MSLVRWDPFRELEDVNNRLNRIFGRSTLGAALTAGGQEMVATPDWTPSVDVVETSEDFQIRADLPDVKRENIRLTVSDGVLRLEGERRGEKEEKGRRYHRVERHYGSFLRTFTLPENIDAAKIHADFKDGVLHVAVPKTAAAAPRAMTIKIA